MTFIVTVSSTVKIRVEADDAGAAVEEVKTKGGSPLNSSINYSASPVGARVKPARPGMPAIRALS